MAIIEQNLKLSDYSTDFDICMNWWRCYQFTVSEVTTVTGLIGGGTDVFYGAIFICDENSTPLEILTSVIFTGSNPDQLVVLDTTIDLHPGINYLIGQARKQDSGDHYIISNLNRTELLDSHPISTWIPEAFNSIRFNSDGSPENILDMEYYDFNGVMPRIGLQYEKEIITTTPAPTARPQFPNYIINENPVSLHQMINYIVDYICNVKIEPDNCFNIQGVGYDIKTVLNSIVTYLCDIDVLPNYINIPYETRDLQGILKYIVNYLCRINLENSCLNVSIISTLPQILNSINEYLCEIQLKYNCLFDEEQVLNLHTLLNKLCYSICNINFEKNCLNISSPNSLHMIIDGMCQYLCDISLKYNCIDEYGKIYNLSVSVIGQGDVDSDPIGISCPSDCQQQFVYGTGVELEAKPHDGWKFDKWKGPYIDEQEFQTPVVDNLYDTLNKILNYLCFIYVYPNCFAEDQTYSLHGILDKLSQYVCHINLDYNCMDMRNYDNLHNTLNGILKYICNVKLDIECFSGEETNIRYFECDTSDVSSSTQYILHNIVDYLCNIPLEHDCWDTSNPATLHEVLNGIIYYLCNILVEENCVTDNEYVTLHEFLEAFDDYLCNIPIEHCFDESFPTTTTLPPTTTTATTSTISSTTATTTTAVAGDCSDDFTFSEWQFEELGMLAAPSGRNYSQNSIPSGALWSTIDGGYGLRATFEDSQNCGGSNNYRQNGSATTTIDVINDVLLMIEWEGIGEKESHLYEKMEMYIDGDLIGEAHAPGGGLECEMGNVVDVHNYPSGYLLTAGTHNVVIAVDTNDNEYHVGAYYQFTFYCQESSTTATTSSISTSATTTSTTSAATQNTLYELIV